MAKIKSDKEVPKKECEFVECRRLFTPEFTEQIYCCHPCRNKANIRQHIIKNLSKYLPEYLLSKSDDELSSELGSLGLRSYDRRKRFKLSERLRKIYEAKQNIQQ